MKKPLFHLLFCVPFCVVFIQSALGSSVLETQGHWTSKPLSFSQVQLHDELGARYWAAACNLLTRTDRYSLASFASSAEGKPGSLWWDWPGDQIGRWLSVLHVAGGYGWTPAAWHRRVVLETALPLRTPDGRFGPTGSEPDKDVRLLSGNAFCVRGLMDAYADTGDVQYLEAARQLGHYFQAHAEAWETRRDGKLHEFYGHCIDGLVALYEQAGDEWALALAERLASHAGRTPHTHHSLSLCRGLVDLARVTKKSQYLDTVADYLTWCREHRNVTGALPESMPKSPQDEGCGLADWIVVNLMMCQATGQQLYVDEAEHTLVNHFALNQFHTGGFGHLLLTDEIVGGKGWQGWEGQFGSENPGCCSLWGHWALGQVGRFIVTESDDTVFVNLYPSATIALPQRGVRLEMTSDFPRMNSVKIRVLSEKPQSFALALRMPPWASEMRVKCNNTDVEKSTTEGTLYLKCTWEGSTTIDIEFVTGLRTVPWPKNQPKGVALFDGPLCLGLSAKTADVELPWTLMVDASGQPCLDDQGRFQITEPGGRTICNLEPIGAGWLEPDVKDPIRRRVLFETKVIE